MVVGSRDLRRVKSIIEADWVVAKVLATAHSTIREASIELIASDSMAIATKPTTGVFRKATIMAALVKTENFARFAIVMRVDLLNH